MSDGRKNERERRCEIFFRCENLLKSCGGAGNPLPQVELSAIHVKVPQAMTCKHSPTISKIGTVLHLKMSLCTESNL